MKKRPTFEKSKEKALKDPEFRAEYERLQPEYDLIRQLLRMRKKSGLSQEQLARKMGTKKPNISRLESPSAAHSPTIKTLQKYAAATGYELQIKFKPVEESHNH